ncbi:acetyltransferase [Diaporthe helianthi]|uniref:Acetyltransferase n=1 Tax=Diaporthe helianthi TaxID=158607 RepID=A0A2P5HFP8_DIAHE|nr:acetyltransferase [Diaporthe helianthi]
MPLSTETTPFSLKTVVPADFPAMAEMCGLAFEDDRHTMLKAAHPTKPYDHAAGMGGAFEYWTSRPGGRLELTKAVDDATGEILGFVCWGISLDKVVSNTDSTDPEQTITTASSQKDAETNLGKPKLFVSADDILEPDSSLDPLEQLEEFTSSHLAAFEERFQDARCMYVITITVHPKHQGRGVGPALIKRGTDRADSEAVLCWVHSSEAGVHTYQKCGFEEDNTLEVDLDSWAQKMNITAPVGEDKWGTYNFRYMVRQPNATSRST